MWKLAWRQLWRNRARTLITGTAIAFAYALFLVSLAIGDGMYGKMTAAAERSAGGAVLVHGDGFWDARMADVRVPSAPAVVAAVAGRPEVAAVSPRVLLEGVLTSASNEGFAGATVRGVDPARERPFNDLGKYLAEGTLLDDDDARGVVLGGALAEDLRVDLGDRVVFRFTNADGEADQALLRLRGVIRTGSTAIDRMTAYIRLGTAQEIARLGDAVTQVGLLGAPNVTPEALAAAAAEALGPRPDLELLTWSEAMPELVGFIEMDSNMNVMTSLLIFIIVAFGIANTFLMSVLERVRELGLLAALGVTPARVGGLVLRETLLLGVMALALGLGLGLLAHLYMSTEGLDYGALMGGDLEVSGVIVDDLLIKSELHVAKWATSGLVVLAMVLLSALYPAWRATRLQPSQAMRTYE